ncbi:unnamed protein product [marine sediment metagenome]|uniref:Uncharacterized protein n=1 Tax=marine sediment metagenome TaxID=412755 RepID=X1ADZ0_9ZZZZ
MIAVIISAMIFFPFADAGQTVAGQSEDFTIVLVTSAEHYNVSANPDSTTPGWVITANNNATALPSANYSVSGTHVTIDANVWGAGNTTATIEYNTRMHSSVGDVITYAIIVQLAVIPFFILYGFLTIVARNKKEVRI